MLLVAVDRRALELVFLSGGEPKLASLGDRDALAGGCVDAVPYLDARGGGELVGLFFLAKVLM